MKLTRDFSLSKIGMLDKLALGLYLLWLDLPALTVPYYGLDELLLSSIDCFMRLQVYAPSSCFLDIRGLLLVTPLLIHC